MRCLIFKILCRFLTKFLSFSDLIIISHCFLFVKSFLDFFWIFFLNSVRNILSCDSLIIIPHLFSFVNTFLQIFLFFYKKLFRRKRRTPGKIKHIFLTMLFLLNKILLSQNINLYKIPLYPINYNSTKVTKKQYIYNKKRYANLWWDKRNIIVYFV